MIKENKLDLRDSHYRFLDEHFNQILDNMGREDLMGRLGSFVSSGDKYYSYKDRWEQAGVPFYHGAAMYHLMEVLYRDEIRETKDGWVDPWKWVIDNYRDGHNLFQYMEDMA